VNHYRLLCSCIHDGKTLVVRLSTFGGRRENWETHAHFKNYYQFTSACRPKYLTSLDIELFTYLRRRPSTSPLLSPDVLADVDVVDLKQSIIGFQDALQVSTARSTSEMLTLKGGTSLISIYLSSNREILQITRTRLTRTNFIFPWSNLPG
jgi:hypothetical protein